ncbi:TPA: protein YqeJ, partial [Escherichia coli]
EIMDQVDDDRLAQLIPDFYVFPEKSVSYNILKQGKHAFILSIGNRAIMHCAR